MQQPPVCGDPLPHSPAPGATEPAEIGVEALADAPDGAPCPLSRPSLRLGLIGDRLLRPPHEVWQVGFADWDNFSEILLSLWSSTRVAAAST